MSFAGCGRTRGRRFDSSAHTHTHIPLCLPSRSPSLIPCLSVRLASPPPRLPSPSPRPGPLPSPGSIQLTYYKNWGAHQREHNQERASTVYSKQSENDNESLLTSASNNQLLEAKRLLMAMVDPNYQDAKGSTALMSATWFGYIEMCKLLVQFKALICIQNRRKNTAMHFAAEKHHRCVRACVAGGWFPCGGVVDDASSIIAISSSPSSSASNFTRSHSLTCTHKLTHLHCFYPQTGGDTHSHPQSLTHSHPQTHPQAHSLALLLCYPMRACDAGEIDSQ